MNNAKQPTSKLQPSIVQLLPPSVKLTKLLTGKNTIDVGRLKRIIASVDKQSYTESEIAMVVASKYTAVESFDTGNTGSNIAASTVSTTSTTEDLTNDTHEMLKTQIGIRDENNVAFSPAYETNEANIIDSKISVDNNVNLVGLSNNYSIYNLCQMLNPRANYKKTYLIFDTRFISYANTNRTRLTWDFNNNANIDLGGINATGPVRDIVSIKLYKFNLPGIVVSSSMRVSVLFEEFASQAFIGHENRRYHMLPIVQNIVTQSGGITPASPAIAANLPIEFTPPYRTQMYLQEPMNYGEFFFRKPVTIIDKLTISFADPYNLISIPQDAFTCTGTSFFIDAAGNTVCDMILTGLATIAVNTILYVDVSGFSTTDPTTDAQMIQFLNNTSYLQAGGSDLTNPPFVAPYNIRIIIRNSTSPAGYSYPPIPIGTSNIFTVYIANYRTMLYTEMTYIDSSGQ